ncbi:MAG TPA: prephenate dehydrogenase/arogenate dehydrogenase family protein [Vicinamibacterales bacterium]|nr:prephenate dehydrogenase/arogenate dehydrogenase family protein [Vicinamibacterales bacterium]
MAHGLAIVGPGLIGTSIALAARRRWPELAIKTIDRGESLSGVGNALVVVLSAPVDAILDALPKLPLVIQPHALVLDTGSTKREIVAAAARSGIQHFVGGHPMAGGTSVANARADLFDDRPWFLTTPESPDALRRATKFVEALGGRPVVLSDRGEEHDRLMAGISHLPQITASMLMAVVARAVGPDNLPWAGAGLRDTTRLAASPAATWQSILATNKDELKPLLKYLASELASIAERLDDREAVRQIFDEANRARAACDASKP